MLQDTIETNERRIVALQGKCEVRKKVLVPLPYLDDKSVTE